MEKNKIEIIHNFIKRHWITYTILTFIPTIWFSLIISFFGEFLKIININDSGEKKFTLPGGVLTFTVVIIPLLITIFNNRHASLTESSKLEMLEKQKSFYEQLNKSVDLICEDKLKRLNAVVNELKGEEHPSPPHIVSNPKKQLKAIIRQINDCLCVFLAQPDLKFKHKDFLITLAYRFPLEEDKQWVWLDASEEKGLALDILIGENSKSTFNYILKGNKPFYFNNDKKDAKQRDQYLYDSNDQTNADNENEIGSIFCCRFQIKKDNSTSIDALLSVSTYQKKFCNYIDKRDEMNKQKLKNIEDNLLAVVQDYFGKRIEIELSLLYLDELYKKC